MRQKSILSLPSKVGELASMRQALDRIAGGERKDWLGD